MESAKNSLKIIQSDKTIIVNIEQTIDGHWVHFGAFRWPIFFAAMPRDWSKGDMINISFEKIHV